MAKRRPIKRKRRAPKAVRPKRRAPKRKPAQISPHGEDFLWKLDHGHFQHSHHEKGLNRTYIGLPVALSGFAIIFYGLLSNQPSLFLFSAAVFFAGLLLCLKK